MTSIQTKIIRAAIIAAPILLTGLIVLSIIMLMRPAVPAQGDLSASSPGSGSQPQTDSQTEIKAVWISFLEMQQILTNRNEAEYTSAIAEYLDNCRSLGINTVIFQVRSHGDAFYKSALFPTSVHFTGTRQMNAPFDPLAITVREAHARDLKIEAWINPYRGPKVEEDKPLNPDGIFAKWLGTRKVFTAGNSTETYYYLNPADPEVRQYVLSGVREVAAGYDVDGIHFDDYFYPTQDPYVDSEEYENNGNGLSLDDFRRKCVSDFMAEVYSTVKSIRDIPFGISPSGNIESNMNLYYADVKLWASTAGYADYLAPQLYWGYGEGELPYDTALAEWEQIITCKEVKLIAGLAAYKVGENEYWHDGDILARQVNDARKSPHYSGFALFRYSYLFSPTCVTERENLFKN